MAAAPLKNCVQSDLTPEQTIELCSEIQRLLLLEKAALLALPEVRAALIAVLAGMQAPTGVRRVSALHLARAVSLTKYGQDNEAAVLESLTP